MDKEPEKSMKKMRSAAGKISQALDIPSEALTGIIRVTVTGTQDVRVESHEGLIEYDTSLISVNCGEKIVSIYGKKLELVSMNADELMIHGDISRLEYE